MAKRRSVRIFLANIPWRATQRQIGDFCACVGEATEVFIPPNDETGGNKDHCFVTLLLPPDAPDDAWMALRGEFLGDRRIRVELANARPEKGRAR
jgi:hypothetical protein